jgi:hypothetical protein
VGILSGEGAIRATAWAQAASGDRDLHPHKKRVFGLSERLATTLVGLATRIAAKIAAYTYSFVVNRMLGGSQGCIKELWA